MGLTPPRTPRSSSRRPSRSRDRDGRRSPRRGDDYEEPEQPNQGWGPRIVLMEKKIAELEAAISTADKAITKTFVDTQAGANDAMGRIDSIERTLPQRIHNIETRQVTFVETMNALTGAINSKIEQVEQLVLSRPRESQHVPPAHAPATPTPPIPPRLGGQQPPMAGPQHFNVGSPLSAPTSNTAGVGPDPWAQYAGPRPAHVDTTHSVCGPHMPANPPNGHGSWSHNGPVGPIQQPTPTTPKYVDDKRWSIAYAKVSK